MDCASNGSKCEGSSDAAVDLGAGVSLVGCTFVIVISLIRGLSQREGKSGTLSRVYILLRRTAEYSSCMEAHLETKCYNKTMIKHMNASIKKLKTERN